MNQDIVFLNPPLAPEEKFGELAEGSSNAPHLGLCYLAANTRANNFKTSIIDSEALSLNYEETVKKILSYNPEFLGITSTTISIFHAAEIAKRIKQTNPNIITILGGSHITAVPEETLKRFSEFDIGIVGEGEETIVDLLNKLKKKENKDIKDLNQVKGIAYREENKIIRTEKRPFIKNLDSLPMPAWDLLPDLAKYYKPSLFTFTRLPSTSLVTSRGCSGRCVFCDRSVFGNAFRTHSSGYVMNMIRHLVENFKIKDIFFGEDNFTLHRRRLMEICEALKKEKLDLTWSCNSRIDSVNDEILKLMKQAGCYQISYGIESGCQKIMDTLRKGLDLNQVKEVLRLTTKAKIRTKGYFMIANPNETLETIKESMSFAKKIDLYDLQLQVMTPFPGSEIYETAHLYGKFDNDWKKMNMGNPIFVPYGLTDPIIQRELKKAYWGFYMRPKIIVSYLKLMRNPGFLIKVFKGMKVLMKLRKFK